MIDAIWTEGRKVITAKQVKKLQPGAMVRVFTETKKGVTNTIAMVTQVGIHKRLMTMDGKLWRIADAPNHLYCLDKRITRIKHGRGDGIRERVND